MKLYNTLTGGKDLVRPIEPGKIRMYVCGVTVYDYCHLGHARSALVFDVLRRYLEFGGLTVEFVKNFTDVDDKIIRRAQEQGVPCEVITDKYIAAYYEDMKRLGVGPAWREPKATEHMSDIIGLVGTLMDKGAAYQIDGDVYFSVEAYPAYGTLSKRRLEDLLVGARVEVDERKRHPMDFALWKSSKPGEPFWDSPWGPGRPGWHIECSAMSMRHLGTTFDIHGGGMDLIFPHHENEMAQSCAATEKEFARCWVHNGFVQINQEKMSKSLGNFFTIRDIFEKSEWSEAVTGEVLRYFLLSTHYRSPVEFSDRSLHDAKNALNGLYDLFTRLGEPETRQENGDAVLTSAIARVSDAVRQAMDDDLNTPIAIAELQKFRGEMNKTLEQRVLSTSGRRAVREAFRSLGRLLGLFQQDHWQFSSQQAGDRSTAHAAAGQAVWSPLSDDDIEARLKERNEARRKRNFKQADAIRQALQEQGIIIEDRPDGTSRWKR